ncbi:MAG: cation:H+ antiporter [Granulosicoccus sp.]|jgi:cation:H+ antiporter
MIELTIYEVGILAAGALVAGIYLLILGGNLTIDAAVAIASRANLSPVFIGATIVAFGTSLPELFTSVNANLQGFPGISLGNIVGSNIANILLVMGACALVCTLAIKKALLARDLYLMLASTVILVVGMQYGMFERWMGIAMCALLIAYVAWQFFNDQIGTSDVGGEGEPLPISKTLFSLVGGFGGLILGSEMLVRGAVVTGGILGVPEAIIGLTAVAVGTSLPELTASIAAALKRETDILFGNIIGSNTFNILWIVGVTSTVSPLGVDSSLMGLQLIVLVLVSVVFAGLIFLNKAFTRTTGFAFLGTYLVFTLYQFRGTVL